jgi:hypothetical protein
MSTTVSLNNDNESLITEKDSIVIVENFESIRGGRSLDVTDFAPDYIRAGHVIIKDGSNNYKPMPATEERVAGVATVGAITAGTGYTNGTYENVPLKGGTGKNVRATVTVAGGVVTVVAITYGGSGYTVADSLSADNTYIGGTGTGFAVPVATVGTTAGAYGSLPASHTYVGINIATIKKTKPFSGIMVRGTVNPAAAPFSMTSIQSAFTAAVPLILFRED